MKEQNRHYYDIRKTFQAELINQQRLYKKNYHQQMLKFFFCLKLEIEQNVSIEQNHSNDKNNFSHYVLVTMAKMSSHISKTGFCFCY